MDILRTKHGLRLSQHGVVISELRTSPGATHSVFDVLAASIRVLRPAGRIGVLGFAGGGMIAPLRGLGVTSVIETVDLDRAGYTLFRRHCPAWIAQVSWQKADAMDWLRGQTKPFDLLVEDLSVPRNGDVCKPAVCWGELPELVASRLVPGGVGVFNLLPPAGGVATAEVRRIASLFQQARIVDFDGYENRILIAGDAVPSARALGALLRAALKALRSRQAGRIRVRSVAVPRPRPGVRGGKS